MKYYRTMNKLFSEEQIRNAHRNNNPHDELSLEDVEELVKWFAPDDRIVKASDNIEDLFDECYLDAPHYREPAIMFSLDDAKLQKSDNERLFGCIWVKLPNGAKRLEPVAEKVTDGWRLL